MVRGGIDGTNKKVKAVTSSATPAAVHNHRVRRKYGDLLRVRTSGRFYARGDSASLLLVNLDDAPLAFGHPLLA